MALPQTYKAFRHSSGNTPKTLEAATEELPSSLKPSEVLIRIHAVSLNYRDVAMMHGIYPVPVTERCIPTSDCAAEVVGLGSDVHDFQIGDRVAPIFDLSNIDGTEEEHSVLGGDVNGVLREYAVFDRNVLFHLPKHLSWEEAACITCAGVTAWNALEMPRSKGTALLQGTGGVSMFGLLICLAAGIRPIITSSSGQKLDLVKAIASPGAVNTINYRDQPKWEEEALRLTNGRGVDVVVDNVGPSSIAQSLASLARRGTVSGIAVGSKADHEALCSFLSEKKIGLKPVLDNVTFSFEDSQAAFDHLWNAKHMGKVVIKL
ncbi:Polyketide synthase, enoylreductase [Penicillium griseofulvum]|uniref:Polyketide synthase, enoylreductase n=1 Tax=Penicillium patulum TaxID=5078 RepID=A0A135LV88_PENPA|nr:Polyketide synthase, enoylreductase [Penicillium griseofulvum]KXG52849.1 Polyketide synthase, enoylreductase [Penicillium griseofulvum]